MPEIETSRLLLRPHRPEDFPECAAMWGDPIVTRYIGGQPFTPEDVWARMLRYAGHWAWVGFGYWAVEEKGTGLFVGELGFANFKRTIVPPLPGVPELGWALASSMHGKGYATEAVRAAVAWGDKHLDSSETVCLIDPHNAASIRVANKCGYQESGQAIYKGHAVTIFVRKRPKALPGVFSGLIQSPGAAGS